MVTKGLTFSLTKALSKTILLISSYENRLIGKPMQKSKVYIKRDLMEVRREVMDWTPTGSEEDKKSPV